jgi:hypothetical protein
MPSGAGIRQVVRNASVGDSLAARVAGYSPATAPIRKDASAPPTMAAGGRSTSHPRLAA